MGSRRGFPLGEFVPTRIVCKEGAFGSGLAGCIDSSGAAAPDGHLNTSEEGVFEYRVLATSSDGQTAEATPVQYPSFPNAKKSRAAAAEWRSAAAGLSSIT